MSTCRSFYLLILFFYFSITNNLFGQDSHYWINQYGTRADLLSGLVVGSVKDLSSTYYNPGAIPLSPEQSLVLTTDAVELSSIAVRNGAGTGEDLVSRQSGTAPGIFVVRLTSSASVKHHWAISYLTRSNFKLNVDARSITDRLPGTGNLIKDYFSGEISYSQNLDEAWPGITYGRNVWDKVAFGITQYLAIRSQKGRIQFMGQLYDQNAVGSSLTFYREFKFDHARTLWKFGFTFNYRPLSFGFTVTTPSVSLIGLGETVYNLAETNIDTTGTGAPVSSLASNYQQNLSTTFRSPLSIALGATYHYRKTSIYFTLEWFDEVNKFKVLEPESFISQSSGDIISTDYIHELKSVTNYGIGLQHEFHEKLAIYLSAIRDNSARMKNSQTVFAISNWDIFHITFGSAFTFWRLDLTGGLTYSFGSEDFERTITPVGLAQDFIEGRFEPTKVDYRRIKLILGFTILSNPDKISS